jgi:potassium-transporting ATPase potassium-binding subunit
MTPTGIFEIAMTLGLVVGAAHPLGAFIADVFENRPTFLSKFLMPIEAGLYRIAGVRSGEEQDWLAYTQSMLVFFGASFLTLYLLQRLQSVLPLNPQGFDAVPPDLAFNTAISFITNANWQAYAGETTMSHLTQMLGLTTHNFLDSATALAMAIALTRAFARSRSETIGNFWVDLTRAMLYILLPISIVLSIAFVALGVPQTLLPWVDATTLEGAKQVISLGPVASQEAIKLLGNNGGGFFNANSAHPFENPSAWSNIIQNWSQLVLPVASVFAFGRMVHDQRQVRSLLSAMAVLFLVALAAVYWAESRGNPLLSELGVDQTSGNLEGKDLRFGQASQALFVAATTGTGTGASNPSLDSLTPIGGLVAMFNLLMGCISPGGAGVGLYSIVLLAVVTVFLSGLMVGRTPEYLGKKIGAREIRLAIFALLVSPLLILGLTGASVELRIALDSLGNAGPHGLSEIVYAYASTASDNGSTFAGLNSNTVWYNATTGVVMLLGRLAHVIPILALGGSIAAKPKAPPSAGSLPTHGVLFVVMLLGTILIVTLLQFLPALALGPIAELFLLKSGAVF